MNSDSLPPGVDSSPGPGKNAEHEKYLLRLYVAGHTHRSEEAVSNIMEIMETHLDGQYELEVVDLYQQPALAEGDQIVAVPTLVKKLPPPLRKIIGDMSDKERVIVGLDLKKQ